MLSHSGRAGKHLTFKKLSQEVQTLKSKKSFAMVFWSLIFCRVSFNNKKTPNFPLWKQWSVLTQMSWKVLRTHILTARGHRVMMKVAVLTRRSTRTGRSRWLWLRLTRGTCYGNPPTEQQGPQSEQRAGRGFRSWPTPVTTVLPKHVLQRERSQGRCDGHRNGQSFYFKI